MAKASVRETTRHLLSSPVDRAVILSGCLLVLLAVALSLRLVTDVDILGCLSSNADLSSRCPLPRSTVSYTIARAIAATSSAGIGFSLLRTGLVFLGIIGVSATIVVAGVSRVGAIIAAYCWLLLAEPSWMLGYPIILFPLISWLWFFVRLQYRGNLADWIWLPFFFVWTLLCGPALGWVLVALTSTTLRRALHRLGYSLLGSVIALFACSVDTWVPRILWPFDPASVIQHHSLFTATSSPTFSHTVGIFAGIFVTGLALMRDKSSLGWPERRTIPLLLALSLFDLRLLLCAAGIMVIQWSWWIPSTTCSHPEFRHIRLHRWLLPLVLLIDIARVGTNTKYIAEGRPDRWSAGFDFLTVPIHSAHWLLAHKVERGGLVAPSLRLVKDWLVLTRQTPAASDSNPEETLLSGTISGGKIANSIVQYAYIALSHRNNEQAQLLDQLVGDPTWRLVHADYLTAVYARSEGPYGALPEFTIRPLYDDSIVPSALKSIQPLQGYREKIARWFWLTEPPPSEAFYFGSFLLRAGKPREASDVLIFAALLSPNASEVTRTLGEASERLGENEIAERAFGLSLMGDSGSKEVRAHFEAAGNAVLRQLGIADILPD